MRFEKWRGMPLSLTLATVFGLGLGWVSLARADGYGLHDTIPRSVGAYDYTTGGEFKAPPVPYGHYAKNTLPNGHKLLGCATCRLHGLMGCAGCGGGGHGHGLGHGRGFGHGGSGPACVVPGCAGGSGCGHLGLFHHGNGAGMAVVATAQSQPIGNAFVQPSGQEACGLPGCGVKTHHGHHGFGKHASCGDPGCGLCEGGGRGHGKSCGFCGGRGCSHCLSGLGSGLHGKLAGLLRHQKVDYFVGPGGPVPLTPGYVPYIVVTRSPRDFFAFPPMNPNDP